MKRRDVAGRPGTLRIELTTIETGATLTTVALKALLRRRAATCHNAERTRHDGHDHTI
jgi:hypothetical protein